MQRSIVSNRASLLIPVQSTIVNVTNKGFSSNNNISSDPNGNNRCSINNKVRLICAYPCTCNNITIIDYLTLVSEYTICFFLCIRNVDYYNDYGSFVDSHTIETINKDGKKVSRNVLNMLNGCL